MSVDQLSGFFEPIVVNQTGVTYPVSRIVTQALEPLAAASPPLNIHDDPSVLSFSKILDDVEKGVTKINAQNKVSPGSIHEIKVIGHSDLDKFASYNGKVVLLIPEIHGNHKDQILDVRDCRTLNYQLLGHLYRLFKFDQLQLEGFINRDRIIEATINQNMFDLPLAQLKSTLSEDLSQGNFASTIGTKGKFFAGADSLEKFIKGLYYTILAKVFNYLCVNCDKEATMKQILFIGQNFQRICENTESTEKEQVIATMTAVRSELELPEAAFPVSQGLNEKDLPVLCFSGQLSKILGNDKARLEKLGKHLQSKQRLYTLLRDEDIANSLAKANTKKALPLIVGARHLKHLAGLIERQGIPVITITPSTALIDHDPLTKYDESRDEIERLERDLAGKYKPPF